MIRKQQYVRKSISNMTEGYDYYDTEILLNGIPVGGLSQHGYLGTAGFGPAPEDCYFNIPIPLQLKVEETVTMLPMEEIMKSVEQYVKEGKNWSLHGTGHCGGNRIHHDSSYKNLSGILY